MMKRNLAAALAVLAISGAVVPMTANAATAEPYNIINTYTIKDWCGNNGLMSSMVAEWAESVDIARKENESEYDYYLRLRDLVAANWSITTESANNAAQYVALAEAHKVDNANFYFALGNLLIKKSALMADLSYIDWGDPNWSSTKYETNGWLVASKKEMENEYGEKQAVPCEVKHTCADNNYSGHSLWEKDVFGIIQLDGKLYAMKMTTDSATCGTLIPYEELGYKNCDFSFGWNTDKLKARGYQTGKSIPLDKNWRNVIHTSVYDADGTYNYLTMYEKVKQALVQGVLLYYCENGEITPMTKALHDTLPKNDTYYYATINNHQGAPLPDGWKLFAD